MTDHINYYDNCAYEDENYYECWLDEWDTDNNGSTTSEAMDTWITNVSNSLTDVGHAVIQKT